MLLVFHTQCVSVKMTAGEQITDHHHQILVSPDYTNPFLYLDMQTVLAAHARMLSYCPHITGKN